jgi:hypothetical protein
VPCCSPFLCVTVFALRRLDRRSAFRSCYLALLGSPRSVRHVRSFVPLGPVLRKTVLQAAQACKTSFTFLLLSNVLVVHSLNNNRSRRCPFFADRSFRLIVALLRRYHQRRALECFLVVDRRGDDSRLVLVGRYGAAVLVRFVRTMRKSCCGSKLEHLFFNDSLCYS